MKDMKFYTLEEIEDKYIGEKGTPKRDKYEADLHSFLIGEAIKQARQSDYLTQEESDNLIVVQRTWIFRIGGDPQERKKCRIRARGAVPSNRVREHLTISTISSVNISISENT